MSYSALYLLPEGGDMLEDSIEYAEYRNAWGGGMVIWRCLWERYVKTPADEHFPLWNMDPIWKLHKDPRVKPEHRDVLFFTFDGCILRHEYAESMADAFDVFSEDFAEELEGSLWHGPAIARDLRALGVAHPDMDVHLMVTSVSGICGGENPFYFPLRES